MDVLIKVFDVREETSAVSQHDELCYAAFSLGHLVEEGVLTCDMLFSSFFGGAGTKAVLTVTLDRNLHKPTDPSKVDSVWPVASGEKIVPSDGQKKEQTATKEPKKELAAFTVELSATNLPRRKGCPPTRTRTLHSCWMEFS